MIQGIPGFFHVLDEMSGDGKCRVFEEDMRSLLSLPGGRRMLRRLLALTSLMDASKAATSESTAYNEGRRSVGIWLASAIEVAWPGEVARLIGESSNDMQTYRARQRIKEGDEDGE